MKAKPLSNEQIEYAVGRLQKVTEGRGFTQTQLEQASGVSQSTISKIFSRTLTPSTDVLKKLFQALGLKLADILYETDGLSHELIGYLGTPLTAVVSDLRAEAELRDVVHRIQTAACAAEFADPRFDLYWPGDHTHPVKNSEFTGPQVYLTDRSRASTHDFMILFCGAPSYGVGQENEIGTQAGLPSIRLMPEGISRMMSGSFILSYDIKYTGSLLTKVHFDDADLAEGLRWVRRLYFRHRALYKSLNGDGFGSRLRRLLSDRCGDYEQFAHDTGISLGYLHALLEEPFTVSNPSARLLTRMAVVLGERVAYLLGESEESDALWVESNASWHSWVTRTSGIDAAAAVRMRDRWREDYLLNRSQRTAESYRKTSRAMQEIDWDKLYQKIQAGTHDDGTKTLF